MSDVTIEGERSGESAFRRGSVLLIVAIGVLAFVGMLVLGAYAPDLKAG